MPTYQYTAMDSAGKEEKGVMDANSEDQVIAKLRNDGYFPTSVSLARGGAKGGGQAAPKTVKAKKKGGGASFGSRNMKQADLTLFTRQLAILLDAGLPLIRSLKTLERQTKTPAVKTVLGECSVAVESGGTFSEALAQHPKSFDKLYLNMIRAGEAAGAMETILNRLAEFMEKSAKITAKVKAAMIYPAVVLSVALLITAGLMIFIVPRFEQIFVGLLGEKEPLPALTVFVVKISNFLQQGMGLAGQDSILRFFEGPIEIVIGLVVLVFIFRAFTKTEPGRLIVDRVKFNAPLFGPIIAKSAIARFSRTLSTLLSAGVPVLQALQIVKETAGNAVVSSAVQVIHDAVKDGEGMAGPLGSTKIFPQMVVAMIEVGEETGKLPEMLTKVADTYDEEVDNAVGALTSAIEPMMIVGLAVIVGTIVIALFLPMIEIIKKMQ